jgi:hypothetical protein
VKNPEGHVTSLEYLRKPSLCLLVFPLLALVSFFRLQLTCIALQEQDEAARKREREKQDAMHKLKTTILVSAMIIAVAGAVFAVTKKLRER